MPDAAARAEFRRRNWSGGVVRNGSPKSSLYAGLSVEERLEAFARLNESVWRSAGVEIHSGPRSEWPGEIFDLRDR